jgi:hypothetical protein
VEHQYSAVGQAAKLQPLTECGGRKELKPQQQTYLEEMRSVEGTEEAGTEREAQRSVAGEGTLAMKKEGP